MNPRLDLTIIIPTQNRADSVAETLACFQRVNESDIQFEILVVENGSQNGTKEVVTRFRDSLPVNYYFEPRAGKCFALNTAIQSAQLGSIVAVLDDDMSVRPDWMQGVLAICGRWPDFDLFSGLSYIIWPDAAIPDWAKVGRINGWAFSVTGTSLKKDQIEVPGDFVSGNHFWFRHRVLQVVPAFKPHWLAEISFMFELQLSGCRGVTGKDAIAGHRIQLRLLEENVLRKRAVEWAREVAQLKMHYSDLTRPGQLSRRRPMVFFAVALGSLAYWCSAYVLSTLNLSSARRISGQLHALERISDRAGMLRNWKRSHPSEKPLNS